MNNIEALGLLVFAIFFRFLLKPVLRRLALRTETKLDDKILDAVTNPLWFAVVLFVFDYFLMRYFPNILLHRLICTLIALFGTVILLRLARILIFDVLGGEATQRPLRFIDERTRRTALKVMNNIATVLIVLFALAYILLIWGIDVSPLLASAGIAGLIIGLALKDPMENLIYGVILALDPSFRVGDVVEIDGTLGRVEEIGLRNTKIVTFSGDMVTVPNSVIANSRVLNYHLPSDRVRVSVRIGVSYDSDPELVKQTLIEIAKSSRYVLDRPAPEVLFLEYGDFALIFELRFWTRFEEKFKALDDVNTRIWKVFKEKGIEIPYPITEVYLRRT